MHALKYYSPIRTTANEYCEEEEQNHELIKQDERKLEILTFLPSIFNWIILFIGQINLRIKNTE